MNLNKTQIRVRYSETDQMQFAHHSNYPVYLEIGRTEWLRNLGISYKKMENSGVMLPVINLNINYLKSAKYDDILTLETKLLKPPTAKIEFGYKIFNSKNVLITQATTTLVFVNMETGRPIRAPKYIMDLVSKLNL